MIKICAGSGKEFVITEDDLKFYAKMGVPTPTLCPEERQRRRLAWRNERRLYKRKCDLCNNLMIATYPQEAPFKVYCTKCWWSDKWNALEYGRNFDFEKSFFEQFNKLNNSTPKPGIINDNETRSENSAYCQDCVNMKNCYLVVETGETRDSMFSHQSNRSVEVFDCYQVMDSELVYESINSQKLYNCIFLQNCEGCSDCCFGYDLRGCKNCFGCVNLRNKQYYFLNRKYSKEEYEKKLNDLNQYLFSLQLSLKNSFVSFQRKFPHRYANFKNCQDCYGNNLFNCKNVLGYDVIASQDSKFVNNVDQISYVYDAQGWKSSWCIETQTADESWMTRYCAWCENCKNIDYCIHCYSSHDLFSCVGLKHAQYCILNKQYTKEEYFKLRDRIIEHIKKTDEWGEFFPIELSPFAYNETVAQEYFLLNKEEVLKRGWKWKEEEIPDRVRNDSVEWEKIPDAIREVSDDITKEILSCQSCSKQYKIQKAELKFYRKMNLPIPRKCPDCRHADRMKLRNPRKLWKRNRDKCSTEIQTTFAPERPEKVYCEACYLKEVN